MFVGLLLRNLVLTLYVVVRQSSSSTAKKIKFPLKISSKNVTKFAGNCGFGHIYGRSPQWKT